MALNSLGLGFVFTARDLASGTIGRLGSELRGMGDAGLAASSALTTGMSVAAAGVIPLTLGLGGLVASLGVVEMAASSLREIASVGSEFENVQIRMAGTLQALHFVDDFEGGMSRSSELIRRIHADAAALPGEAQDYVNVFTAALPQIAGAMDGNLTDMTAWADRFTAIAISLGVDSSQAARDLQLMLATNQGRAGANVLTFQRLLPFIQATGEHAHLTAEEFNRMSETERWEVLEGAMVGLNDQLAASGGTWDAIVGATATMWDNLVRLAGAPVFDQMKRQLDRINDMFTTSDGNLTEFGQSIADVGAALSTSVGAALEGVVDLVVAIAPSITAFLDDLAAVLRALPTGFLPTVLATFAMVSAFLALGGAVTILVGLGIMVAPFLGAVVAASETVIVVMGGVVVAIGAVIASALVLREMAARNIVGFGDFVQSTFGRARLAVQALVQVFSEGGFSGAIRDELNATENSGIREFVVSVFRIGYRVVQFFRGVGIAFGVAFDAMGPTVEQLVAALTEFGAAFGFVETGIRAVAGVGSGEFAETGAGIGEFLGRVVELAIYATARFVEFATAFVDGFSTVWSFLSPIFEEIGPILTMVGDQFDELLVTIGARSREESASGADGLRLLAEVLGGALAASLGFVALVLEGFVILIGVVIRVVRGLADAFNWLGDMAATAGVRAAEAWMNTVDTIRNAIDRIISSTANLVSRIPPSFRSDGMDAIVDAGAEADRRIEVRARESATRGGIADAMVAGISARPAAAEAEERAIRGARSDEAMDRVAAMLERQATERRTTVLQVDGETIATAVERGDRSRAAAEGIPVPATR